MQKTTKKRDPAQELKPYENKWVALVDNQVIAFGESPKEVAQKAEQQGYRDYTFYLVPSFSVSFAP